MGRKLLLFGEELAKARGIDTMRLDSDEDNGKLAEYYTKMGYTELDRFVEGPYRGIRREKEL